MMICDHGNCHEEETSIVLSSKRDGIRKKFCTYAHASFWALEEAEMKSRNDTGETLIRYLPLLYIGRLNGVKNGNADV